MHPFPYCGTAAQGHAKRQLPDPNGYHFWHVREFNMWTFVRTSAQAAHNPARWACALAYSTTMEVPNHDLGVTINAILEY